MKPMTLMLNKGGCRCWAALLGLSLPAFGLWAADTNAPQATAPALQTNAAPPQAPPPPAPGERSGPTDAGADVRRRNQLLQQLDRLLGRRLHLERQHSPAPETAPDLERGIRRRRGFPFPEGPRQGHHADRGRAGHLRQ